MQLWPGMQAQGNLDWSLPESFHLHFEGLEGELYVGGVYLRRFLKQPGYALSAPKVTPASAGSNAWAWLP